MSSDFLLRKLGAYGQLPETGQQALLEIASRAKRKLAAGQDLIAEGDNPKDVYLITSGWAYRYKYLDDGRRQILACFIPGDLADLHVYILKEMDHSIAALTPIEYVTIPPSVVEELGDAHPRVLRALWWESLVADSIQREWTVSAGQRDAYEALTHMLCELYLRMRLVGLVTDRSFFLPLTQKDVGDALGLTPTHVGRVVKKLNASGLATLNRRQLVVHDLTGLKRAGRFNPNYLHFQGD